jgi:transposase
MRAVDYEVIPGVWRIDDEALTAKALGITGSTECPGCISLEAEKNHARTEAGYWKAMHRRAVEREKGLKQKLEKAKAELKQLKARLTESKSEQKGGSQSEKVGKGNQSEPKRRGQRRGEKGHGRRHHDGLGAEDDYRDLPDSEKVCKGCNKPFVEFPTTDDSQEIVIQVRAHVRVIKRMQYTAACDCPGNPGIIAAPSPAKLIPKGSLGISVWVLVLIDKYLLQRPTSRLLEFLRLTQGLDIPQGTVAGGLKRLAPLFEPLYEEVIERNRSESRWHADETGWLVFYDEQTRAVEENNRWKLWVFRSQTTVVYKIERTKEAKVVLEHYGPDAEGVLNVDRFSSYKVLLRDGRILLAYCWVHVRRDFLRIAKDWPSREGWALAWVKKIGELFRLNKERQLALDSKDGFASAQTKLEKAIERMAEEREAELADPKLPLACTKALTSLKKHWSGLVLFVEHPEVPMDNNQAERDLRGPVVGRKNYYGSGSHWSARLTAMLLTIFQTLLLESINIQTWLTVYLEACAEAGGKVPEQADSFLPWNLSKEQLCRFQKPIPSINDSS